MKAIVSLVTWKEAENKSRFNLFDEASRERYLFEADNIDEAKLKVLKNFPAEKCIGYFIKLENGDFACDACKDYWFYDDMKQENIYTFGVEVPTEEMIRQHLIKCVENRLNKRC